MKVGDKVFVRKPADIDEGPSWVSQMDEYDGTIQEISGVYGFSIYIKPTDYTFSKKWVTPVFENKGKYYRIADKGDIGKHVTVSDQSEKIALLNNFTFTLVEITSDELPFIAGGERWKYALIEIDERPADNLDNTLEGYLRTEGIWCDTYEEKYALLSYFGDKGYKWSSGSAVHAYDWKKTEQIGVVRAYGKRLVHGESRRNSVSFSKFPEYAEIMRKYAPAAETTSETPQETTKEPEMFVHKGKKYRLATQADIGKRALFTDYGLDSSDKIELPLMAKTNSSFFSHTTEWKYAFIEIQPEKKESRESKEMLGSHVIPTTVNWGDPFSKEFMTVTYNPAMQVEWDNPVTPYQKTEGTPLTKEETSVESKSRGKTYKASWWPAGWMVSHFDPPKFGFSLDEKSSESEKKMTKPSMFVVGTNIRPSESWQLPIIVNYLDSKGYKDLNGRPLNYYDDGNVIRIQPDKRVLIYRSPNNTGRCISEFAEYEEIISPAALAAKPQKESKMALLSLASKKVRGLAYGALDWAFISPLKRTFKPVATIAQFSICYLTLAAAGYFAYGLYQNPQSVVEWISEISPVEIRLKNTEE